MNLSTVLAGCLVLVFSAVNTQAQECPDNVVIVFDCLDQSNTALWDAARNYTQLIIQHMPGTADESKVPIALFALNRKSEDDVLVTKLDGKDAQKKRALMASIGKIKADRGQIILSYSIGQLFYSFVFPERARNSKNSVVVIKDASVPGGITTDVGDSVHTSMVKYYGKPIVFHFIRINDAAEDDGMKNLTAWYNNTKVEFESEHGVVDHPKSSYTDLTPQAAFNFVKDALHCEPFGKGGDTEEALGGPSTASNYSPLPLTKTTLPGVVGLWLSVLIVTTAASTF